MNSVATSQHRRRQAMKQPQSPRMSPVGAYSPSMARRVMEILEQAATPAARDLLSKLAEGGAEEDLRDMAQAAHKRLN